MPMYKPSGNSWDEILEGKISWHNLVNPDEEGKWKCRIYPTPESLEKINELKKEGLMNVLKKDDEGYSMNFSRQQQKVIRGKIVPYHAPIVLDKEGKPTSGTGIGHGSDVRIKLQIYRFNRPGGQGKAVAARLEAVRVINLVPYEKDRDMSTDEVRQMKGLDDPIF